MSDLTVISVVGGTDNGLLKYMIESVYKHTTPRPKILLCDTTNGTYSSLEKCSKNHGMTVVCHNPSLRGGSNVHGESLNKLIKRVDTTNVAIVETDCVITMDGWHNIEGYDMIAAIKSAKKDVRYHAAFMVLKADVAKKIDFRAGTDKSRSHNKSYSPEDDVAWRVSGVIKPEDVKLVKFIDAKSGKGQYLDSKFQSDEFWIGGKCVCLHFGRGSNIKHGKPDRKGFPSHKKQLKNFKKIAGEFV